MTYTPNIPQANQTPAGTCTAIQTNFDQFAQKFSNPSAVLKNHTSILDKTHQGDHENVIMNQQGFDPGVTQKLDVLYTKVIANIVTPAGVPELFLQIPKFLPNNIPNSPMQLTYPQINTAGSVITGFIYQSFLPGGFILYFGTVNSAATIVLSPEPSAILLALAIPSFVTGSFIVPAQVSTELNSTKQFRIVSNVPGANVYKWLAIGKQ